jgi:hypothetical protein
MGCSKEIIIDLLGTAHSCYIRWVAADACILLVMKGILIEENPGHLQCLVSRRA